MPVAAFPTHVQIQTTTGCGAACSICPHPVESPAWANGRMSDELFDRIIEVACTGLPVLMVEQNARQALEIADKGYVLVQGQNAHTGSGSDLLNDPEVRQSFLGG